MVPLSERCASSSHPSAFRISHSSCVGGTGAGSPSSRGGDGGASGSVASDPIRSARCPANTPTRTVDPGTPDSSCWYDGSLPDRSGEYSTLTALLSRVISRWMSPSASLLGSGAWAMASAGIRENGKIRRKDRSRIQKNRGRNLTSSALRNRCLTAAVTSCYC
jgi:hypothetical protein